MRFKNRLALAFLSAVVLSLPAMTTAQEPAGQLIQIFEFHVKAGHNDQFRAGVTAWKECYLAQKGNRSWNIWQRQQGRGNVYSAAFTLPNWAALDTPHEAGQKCQTVVTEKIWPHVHTEKGSTSYAKLRPDLSRSTPVSDLILVTNFRANDNRLMMRTVEQVIGAIAEAAGQPRGYWYTVQGGDPGGRHHFSVLPYENFAALDAVGPDEVWALVTKARGEAASERLRADFGTSLDSSWSYLWRRVPELSHNP